MKMDTARIERWFRISGKVSIGAVLVLIMVGGIVRSTGAGMGCPDWPKCFGQWVPPTDESQLPANYHEIYADHGYATMAFNPVKTWTEYINRLVGALIGLFVLVTAALSLTYRKSNPKIFVLSLSALLMTGFQGWLGAKVVDLNLQGWVVTVHMLFALLILTVLISAVFLAHTGELASKVRSMRLPAWLRYVSIAVLVLTGVQILLGTQVRENIDQIAEGMAFEGRDTWVAQLGAWFSWHKVFYFSILAAMLFMARGLLKHFSNVPAVKTGVYLMLGLVAAEVLFGIVLANFALPFWMQPLHLTFAILVFSIEYGLFATVLLAEKTVKSMQPGGLQTELSTR